MWFVSVHMVHSCSRIDMATAWNKYHFISLDRSDFYMIDNLSIAVHTFAKGILVSLLVNATMLPRHVNLSTNFRGPPLRVDVASSHLKHRYSHCLHQAMQQGFSLGRCICKKCYIICIIHVYYIFCRISSASCFF